MKATVSVAVAMVLGLLTCSAGAQEVIGKIKNSSGQVRVERLGVQAPIGRGADVLEGDRLITGPDGHATIAMRRAAPLTIGPQNDVDLDRFAAGEVPVVKRPAPAILQSLASFFAVNRRR